MTITAASTFVGHVDYDEQRQLAAEIRAVVEQAPWITPVAGGKEMSVRISNAGPWGWLATRERGYHYADRHPATGKLWAPIPAHWLEVATRFGGDQPWDCAHIVRYDPGAKLGFHTDNTEHDLDGVVVTISLGDDAWWDVMVNGEQTSVLLSSGDVTLLAGPSRDVKHRIRRVLTSDIVSITSPLLEPGRIALSIRSGAGPRRTA